MTTIIKRQPQTATEFSWAALLEIGRDDLVPYMSCSSKESDAPIPHVLYPQNIRYQSIDFINHTDWFPPVVVKNMLYDWMHEGLLPIPLSDVAILEKAMQIGFGGIGAQHECRTCLELFQIAKYGKHKPKPARVENYMKAEYIPGKRYALEPFN